MYKAEFVEVSRKLFDKVADMVYCDDETKMYVDVYYRGSGYRGTMTIETRGGYEKQHKKALAMFVEEYCK